LECRLERGGFFLRVEMQWQRYELHRLNSSIPHNRKIFRSGQGLPSGFRCDPFTGLENLKPNALTFAIRRA